MKNYLKVFIVLLCFQYLSCGQVEKSQVDNQKIEMAIKSADAWLKLIDSNNYDESWEESSELFRNAVTKEKWNESLNGLVPPLGKVISREVNSSSYKTSVPGAPDGEYVVIVYKTEFENKENSFETVTPMVDKDGNWRVSGYFIK